MVQLAEETLKEVGEKKVNEKQFAMAEIYL